MASWETHVEQFLTAATATATTDKAKPRYNNNRSITRPAPRKRTCFPTLSYTNSSLRPKRFYSSDSSPSSSPYSSSSELEHALWLLRKREELEGRREAARRACHARGADARWGQASRPDLIVDTGHRVGFCRNGKAATSTLLRHFLRLDDTLSEAAKAEFQVRSYTRGSVIISTPDI